MSRKYRAFPPYNDGHVMIGCERLEDCLSEIAPLHEAHYAETEEEYLDHPYNPDYERLFALEKNGHYVTFTVRRNLELVGYIQYHVFRDLHTQSVYTAREDCLYLSPAVRGEGIAPKLLAFAEQSLKQLSVKYVGMTSKNPVGGPDLKPFLEKRGYRHVAEYFSKKLED
jgi:GNAT superfamily N-acetyltransferase